MINKYLKDYADVYFMITIDEDEPRLKIRWKRTQKFSILKIYECNVGYYVMKDSERYYISKSDFDGLQKVS